MYRERVPRRRGDRPGRLPALRPQRGRRAGLHAAAHVRGASPRIRASASSIGPAWSRPESSPPRRPMAGRQRVRQGPRRAPGRGPRASTRSRCWTAARRRSPPRRRPSRSPRSRRKALRTVNAALLATPAGLHGQPEARQAARPPAGGARRPGAAHRVGAGRGARLRVAAGRGHPDPAHRPGHGARHLQPAPPGPARRRDRRRCTCRSSTCPARGPASSCTTARSPSTRASASSTATRPPRRRRWCCGRRSTATSSTGRRSSSTSSSSPGWPSGGRPRA